MSEEQREDQQWEYCILQKSSTIAQSAGVTVSAHVTYCGESAESLILHPQNWDNAIGQLGRGGWKLVSATATQAITDTGAGTTDTLYFKRQVQEGRKTSEPKLIL
jgi:hypothetical protein